MRKRRRKKVLLGVVLLLGLTLLICYIHHVQLRSALNRYIGEMEKRGEVFDIQRLSPPRPATNQIAILKQAINQLRSNRAASSNAPPLMRLVAPSRAVVSWQQPEIRDVKYATNSWNEFQSELNEAKTEIVLLRSLADNPVWNFDLDYSQGRSLLLPHLSPLKHANFWLDSDAMLHLHNHERHEAYLDLRAMLALVKGQADEPLEISQLVRIAMAQMSMGASWQFLQYRDTPDEELAQLQKDWESLDFIAPLERALLMERAMDLQSIELMRKSSAHFGFSSPAASASSSSPSDVFEWFDSVAEKIKQSPGALREKWNDTQWRWYWSYKDELLALKISQINVESARMAKTNHSWVAVQSFATNNFSRLHVVPEPEGSFRIDFVASDLKNVFSIGALGGFKALPKAMTAQTVREIVLTAIALKRFELRHGSYPAGLEELIPTFQKSLPTDYMDGSVLRYRTEANSFLLYSVGRNGKDDGGIFAPANEEFKSHDWLRGSDFVWPRPASSEEIQLDDERILKLKD